MNNLPSQHGLPLAGLQSFLLASWAWAWGSGFALASLSRRTTWVNSTLFCCALLVSFQSVATRALHLVIVPLLTLAALAWGIARGFRLAALARLLCHCCAVLAALGQPRNLNLESVLRKAKNHPCNLLITSARPVESTRYPEAMLVVCRSVDVGFFGQVPAPAGKLAKPPIEPVACDSGPRTYRKLPPRLRGV